MSYALRTNDFPEAAATVRSLLAEVCAIDPSVIRSETPLIEYGLDSARAIDFIVALEDSFGVRISDETAATMKTVQDVVAFIERGVA